MTYFPKNQNSQWSAIIPSILLPLIYKDSILLKNLEKGTKSWSDQAGIILTDEIPVTLYLALWRLSSLMISDLIEDKLGYEKEDLKLIDQLSSDLSSDSLDLVEIALYLEKAAGIQVHEGLEFQRVSDLIDYVFSILVHRIQKSPIVWSKSQSDFLSGW